MKAVYIVNNTLCIDKVMHVCLSKKDNGGFDLKLQAENTHYIHVYIDDFSVGKKLVWEMYDKGMIDVTEYNVFVF